TSARATHLARSGLVPSCGNWKGKGTAALDVSPDIRFHGKFVRGNWMERGALEVNRVHAPQTSRSTGHGERSEAAQNLRSVVKKYLIDRARFEGRPIDLAPGLDHDVQTLAFAQQC